MSVVPVNASDGPLGGGTDTYTYTFDLISASDLRIFVTDVNGVETLTAALSVDLTLKQIVLPAPTNATDLVTLKRESYPSQPAQLSASGGMNPHNEELRIDKLTRISQENRQELLRVPKSANTQITSGWAGRPEKVLIEEVVCNASASVEFAPYDFKAIGGIYVEFAALIPAVDSAVLLADFSSDSGATWLGANFLRSPLWTLNSNPAYTGSPGVDQNEGVDAYIDYFLNQDEFLLYLSSTVANQKVQVTGSGQYAGLSGFLSIASTKGNADGRSFVGRSEAVYDTDDVAGYLPCYVQGIQTGRYALGAPAVWDGLRIRFDNGNIASGIVRLYAVA